MNFPDGTRVCHMVDGRTGTVTTLLNGDALDLDDTAQFIEWDDGSESSLNIVRKWIFEAEPGE